MRAAPRRPLRRRLARRGGPPASSLHAHLRQPLREPGPGVGRRHSLQLAERLVAELAVEARRLKGPGAQEAHLPAAFPGFRFGSTHERAANSAPTRGLVDPDEVDEEPVPETQADESAEELAPGASHGQHHADVFEGADALQVESEKPLADLVRGLVQPLRLEYDLRRHVRSGIIADRYYPGRRRQ